MRVPVMVEFRCDEERPPSAEYVAAVMTAITYGIVVTVIADNKHTMAFADSCNDPAAVAAKLRSMADGIEKVGREQTEERPK